MTLHESIYGHFSLSFGLNLLDMRRVIAGGDDPSIVVRLHNFARCCGVLRGDGDGDDSDRRKNFDEARRLAWNGQDR